MVPLRMQSITGICKIFTAGGSSLYLLFLRTAYRSVSLLVEPKQPADTLPGPPASDMRQLFSWATRSQPQQPSPVHPVP
jgi:hypothetical protein